MDGLSDTQEDRLEPVNVDTPTPYETADDGEDEYELAENVQAPNLQSLDYQMKRVCEVQSHTARTLGQVIDLSQSLNKRMEALVALITEKMEELGNETSRNVREIRRQSQEILTRMEESTNKSTSNPVGPEPPLHSTIQKKVSSCEGLNETVVNVSQLSDNRVLKCVAPDLFRGKKQSIWDYLIHFNMYGELSQWDESQKQRVLLLSVKDEAANYLYSIDKYKEKSFEELCALLTERFEEVKLISAEKLKLSQRRREKGESWYELVQDIERMCAIVYRGGHIIEREAKAAFMQKLPEAIKGPVAAANPGNIKEAVRTVIHMCSVLDVDECGNTNTSSSKVKVKYTGPTPGRNQNENQGQEGFNVGFVSNNGMTDKSTGACFYCHKVGHFIQECRKRIQQEAEAAAGNDQGGGPNNTGYRDDRNSGNYNDRSSRNYNDKNSRNYNDRNSRNYNDRGPRNYNDRGSGNYNGRNQNQQDFGNDRISNSRDYRNDRRQDNYDPKNARPTWNRNQGYFDRNAAHWSISSPNLFGAQQHFEPQFM